VYSVAFSPDGKRIVSASNRGLTSLGAKIGKPLPGEVKVWDAQTGRETLTLKGDTAGVTAVAFSPDGKRLATASSGGVDTRGKPLRGDAKVWDARTGRQTLELKASESGWRSMPATRHWGQPPNVMERVQQDIRALQGGTLKGYIRWTECVAFSPDGKRLVSTDWDLDFPAIDPDVFGGGAGKLAGDLLPLPAGKVRVWDAATGRQMLSLNGHTGHVNSLTFSPDGKRIVTGGRGQVQVLGKALFGEVRVWDAQTGEQTFEMRGHMGTVSGVAFSPDGKRIVSASHDKTVRVWDARTGKQMLVLTGHADIVTSVAFSPDGKRIVSASRDHTVRVWDISTGQ
jgi:WD40 repeat protein